MLSRYEELYGEDDIVFRDSEERFGMGAKKLERFGNSKRHKMPRRARSRRFRRSAPPPKER